MNAYLTTQRYDSALQTDNQMLACALAGKRMPIADSLLTAA